MLRRTGPPPLFIFLGLVKPESLIFKYLLDYADYAIRRKLREQVGMDVDSRVTVEEAKAARAFDWQLPLDLQPLL